VPPFNPVLRAFVRQEPLPTDIGNPSHRYSATLSTNSVSELVDNVAEYLVSADSVVQVAGCATGSAGSTGVAAACADNVGPVGSRAMKFLGAVLTSLEL